MIFHDIYSLDKDLTLGLWATENALFKVVLNPKEQKEIKPHAILDKAKGQLDLYFQGELKSFDLPIDPKGTTFQKEVWQQLKKISYANSISYADLAQAMGLSRHYSRAIGRALNKNPLPIILACHRVVGKNNRPTGYAGGLSLKQRLLDLESSFV